MTPPRRIASLVPSATETVCRLGQGDRLVARTRYCVHPAGELRRVPALGGTKNPQLERILAQRPDLVLGNAEENREQDLDWLRRRVPVLVQSPTTVAAARRGLVELGAALGAEAAAARLDASVDAALRAARRADRTHGRLRVVYAIWRKPWMAAGAGTYIDDVLRLAGVDNAAADLDGRYPAFDPVAVDPDLVLLPDEPWEFDAAQREQLRAAGTFGEARLICCSGRDFCWHGAHTGPGLQAALAALLPHRPRAAAP